MGFALPPGFKGQAIDLRRFQRAMLEKVGGQGLLVPRCCVCGLDFVGIRGIGTRDGHVWAHCACLYVLWADVMEEKLDTYDDEMSSESSDS